MPLPCTTSFRKCHARQNMSRIHAPTSLLTEFKSNRTQSGPPNLNRFSSGKGHLLRKSDRSALAFVHWTTVWWPSSSPAPPHIWHVASFRCLLLHCVVRPSCAKRHAKTLTLGLVWTVHRVLECIRIYVGIPSLF
jgi:hypothetical protein